MTQSALLDLHKQYLLQPSKALMSQLVEAYLCIAKAIAKRFVKQGVEYDDLVQVASIALMKAIERFDPDMGNKFITYATPTIAGDLRNYIRDKESSIKYARSYRSILYNMEKHREAFQKEHFREPSLNELAQSMNIPKADLVDALMLQNATNTISIDYKPHDEEGLSLGDMIANNEDCYEQIDNSSFMEWVKANTSDQEFSLIKCRFFDNLSQRETASILKVSQMQISRLEKRILTRLKSKVLEEETNV